MNQRIFSAFVFCFSMIAGMAYISGPGFNLSSGVASESSSLDEENNGVGSTAPAKLELKGVQGIGESVKSTSSKLKSAVDCDSKNPIGAFKDFCEAANECVGSVEALPVQVADMGIDRAILVIAGGLAKVSGFGGKLMESLTTRAKKRTAPLQEKYEKAKTKADEVKSKAEDLHTKAESYVQKADEHMNAAVDRLGQVDSGSANQVKTSFTDLRKKVDEGVGEFKAVRSTFENTKDWLFKTFDDIKSRGIRRVSNVLKSGENVIEAQSVALATAGVTSLDRSLEKQKTFWLAKKLMAAVPMAEFSNETTRVKELLEKSQPCTEADYDILLGNLIYVSSQLTAMRIAMFDKKEIRAQELKEEKKKAAQASSDLCRPLVRAGFRFYGWMEEYEGYAFDNPNIRSSCGGAFETGMEAMRFSASIADKCLATLGEAGRKRFEALTGPQELIDQTERRKRK